MMRMIRGSGCGGEGGKLAVVGEEGREGRKKTPPPNALGVVGRRWLKLEACDRDFSGAR